MFLNGCLADDDLSDSLGTPACEPLRQWWQQHSGSTAGLRRQLRLKVFAAHCKLYSKRPIYWPLCSARRTFVVWVNIHRLSTNSFAELLTQLRSWMEPLRNDADRQELRGLHFHAAALHPTGS